MPVLQEQYNSISEIIMSKFNYKKKTRLVFIFESLLINLHLHVFAKRLFQNVFEIRISQLYAYKLTPIT